MLLSLCVQQKTKCEEKLEEAKERLNDTVGPRGLQTLIHDRIKHGVMLPFKVSIRKHSRLALVGWESTPEEGAEVELDENGNPIEVSRLLPLLSLVDVCVCV